MSPLDFAQPAMPADFLSVEKGPSVSTPLDFYQQRLNKLQDILGQIRASDAKFSRARGIVFLVSLLLFLGWATGFGTWLLVLSAIVFVVFILVLARHEQLQRDLNREQIRRSIVTQQMARMQRDWDSLPPEAHQPAGVAQDILQQHSPALDDVVVSDLNILGPGSLWSLVNQAATAAGQTTLSDWFRNPADPEEVADRQAAVKWLAQQPELCLKLYLHGRLLSDVRGQSTEFVDWAEGTPWSASHAVQIWTTRWLAVAITVVVAGLILGLLPQGAILVVLVLFVINVVCNMLWIGDVHDLFNQISAGKYDLQYYTELFRAVDSLPESVPRLARLKQQMQTGDVPFETSLAKLQQILQFANGRKSGLLGVPWLVAQILWFWDFHVLLWLETWQARFGSQVRHWFSAVGELEALASLATLAHDHPHWQFPSVSQDETTMSAQGMGHPLLAPNDCVTNDVSIGPPGSFLLVTGSNMSGKSTLLRAVGVNTILGLAGGPVCADAVRLPPLEIATSMRVSDSLNSGLSFFMAELQRVKEIVDRAKQLCAEDGPRMLYLLDEILQGTNSAERHIAVTRILQHLLSTRALGAVSTHDLELAGAPDIQGKCDLVNLRETIEQTDDGERMRFDYVLHEGVTPTTNALRLLDMVGLKRFEADDS